ncbi:NADH:ubiquinone oxidoreductase [Shinella sp.]|uniref:NADH:ubiquinone oxidoreductase n=1 Tax=Shinella sp. TaxID=1870904 RepID=UPI0029B94A8B|nr:NADH:ubiquinone oxidoreductase [Shinella sp.]MDX3973415.1 NADH:ubiquinone oxidoreductase [Shinella sp.]
MTKPAGQDANATRVQPAPAAGDDPFGLAPWLKEMPGVPLHPLMAHPVAAMAATTAIGFSIAGQMAGLMLGAMQTAAERAKVALDDAVDVTAKAEEPAPERKIKVARESATPKTVEAKPARKAPAAKAAKADDLKVISGIGPKLEQVLNGMGFRCYADIAALKAEDVARIEAELGFAGRIARDRWVEQAKALVKDRG